MDQPNIILQAEGLHVLYDSKPAVSDVNLAVERNRITAIIGPSGCGKSTLLRCFNRMNDLIPAARISGRVMFDGVNLYDPNIDPTDIRYQIGMVFQRPNPFPKSIYDNVAFGPRINGFRGDMSRVGGKVAGARRLVGGSERPALLQRSLPLRRTTTTVVHRPGPGG